MGIKRILFVCLGNICRSPAAEGAFRSLVESQGLEKEFLIDSCGTANYHTGELPDPRTRQVAKSRGIHLTHRARTFTASDFEGFDYILAMDQSNFENLKNQAGNKDFFNKLFLFREFDPSLKEPNSPKELIVPDPYYGEISDFQLVQEIVERCSLGFLNHLRSLEARR